MIGKIHTGHDTRGLLQYLLGPGRHNEHTYPHVVAGADPVGQVWAPRWEGEQLRTGGGRDDDVRGQGSVTQPSPVSMMADDLDRWFLQQRALDYLPGGVVVPRTARRGPAQSNRRPHVIHAILAVPAQQGHLGDECWRQIAEEYVDLMGWQRCQWAAIHHGETKGHADHVHLVVNRVQADGRWVSKSWDFRRSREACRALEERHGLTRMLDKNGPGLPGHTADEARHAREQGHHPEAEHHRLEQPVRIAATTEPEFVALRASGVRVPTPTAAAK